MTYNFCTLFDRNYIFRGLAMYFSLKKHCPDLKLWILCMDEAVYRQLQKMRLPQVELVKLSDFEAGDEELLKIKPGRSLAEYCWTISSSLPLYIFKNNPQLDNLAYLDSDLYFFSSPAPIYDEMGDSSISIVRHNYSKELSYLEKKSGIYNVSMVIFKNDQRAKNCLRWWRERCLEWCYSYYDNGKFGDQMYLDDWPTRFPGVQVVKNKGANLAPWNLNKYTLTKKDEKIFVDEDELIYYHFHSLKMYRGDKFEFYSSYFIARHDREFIYPLYINEVRRLTAEIKDKFPDYAFGFNQKPGIFLRVQEILKRKLLIFFYLKSWYRF